MRRSLSHSLLAAAMAATFFAPPALSQGALKPVDAMIVNPPSRPVPVEVLSAPMPPGEGSRTPYRVREQLQFAGGNFGCANRTQLPAGKRLVLTHVGGFASLPAPAALSYVTVDTIEAGQITDVVIVPAAPPLPEPTDSRNLSAAGQQVHAYIDATLRFCVRTAGVVTGSAFVQLSGYLVDKP
jgi:hypothetical protein